jgi:hypothetical protein
MSTIDPIIPIYKMLDRSLIVMDWFSFECFLVIKNIKHPEQYNDNWS